MKLLEAIKVAMTHSLDNAEQWLDDGITLIQKGSTVHGSVLLDFAGEELAKAYACWQVIIGAFPETHPIVKPNRKVSIPSLKKKIEDEYEKIRERVENGKPPGKTISVFKSHAMKDALLIDLAQLINRLSQLSEGVKPDETISAEAQEIMEGLGLLLGEIGAMKRMAWMYVNLVGTGTGYEVTSPLTEELGPLEVKISLRKGELEFLRNMVSRPPTEFHELGKDLASFRKKNDSFWPK
ncbi:MAG: hypothetical protein ACFFER_05565 [Candidatus Thorarchaeota archaeon]